MKITLQLMRVEDKPLLVRLLELYNYEFTAYDNSDINESGCFERDPIDDYWIVKDHYPYLIRVDGKIAGFALVCPRCRFINGENTRSIGEFFVLLKYRRMGIGQWVATELFNKHNGIWEVCYFRNNIPASKFWKKVIKKFTGNHYKLCGENDKIQIGYTFQS